MYSFGMIASDESNNRSPISVIAKLVGGNNCNNGSGKRLLDGYL